MRDLDKLKTIQVDTLFLENFYKEFVKNKISVKFNTYLIPLANLIVSKFLKRHSTKALGVYSLDELYSECYMDLLTTVKKLSSDKFPNWFTLHSYLKTSSTFHLHSFVYKKHLNFLDIKDYDVPEIISHTDIRQDFDFRKKSALIQKEYTKLISKYAIEDRRLLANFLSKYLLEEPLLDKKSPEPLIQNQFSVSKDKYSHLLDVFNLLLKLSIMLSLDENLNLPTKIAKRNKLGDIEVDSFYVSLMHLDKYPFLVELYEIFGPEKFKLLLQIFGGTTLQIPTLDELEESKEISQIVGKVLASEDLSNEDIKVIIKNYNPRKRELKLKCITYYKTLVLKRISKAIELSINT